MNEKELMFSGHPACQGCGATIAMRYVLKALGEKTIVTIPACCWTIIAGALPASSLKVPVFHTAFETAAAAASGIKAGLEMKGDKETHVLAWAGDGGTFDIGLQALSAAAERNEDIIYACYDNEAYMNTGTQRSSATPLEAWTTTTPKGKIGQPKKDIMAIMASHRIPYAATASIAFHKDLMRKVTRTKEIRGFKFFHILSPCPPGWRYESGLTIKLARLAIQTKIFPLYEIENGTKYTVRPISNPKPVEEYLMLQARFKHLTREQFSQIQRAIDQNWERLQKLASLS